MEQYKPFYRARDNDLYGDDEAGCSLSRTSTKPEPSDQIQLLLIA